MAKKETIKLNMSISTCKGIFDKDANGNYIVIVNEKEYLLDEIAEHFLGGSISLDSSCDGE